MNESVEPSRFVCKHCKNDIEQAPYISACIVCNEPCCPACQPTILGKDGYHSTMCKYCALLYTGYKELKPSDEFREKLRQVGKKLKPLLAKIKINGY